MYDLRINPERLRLLRESRNLSQDDLAAKAMISQAYVARLEKHSSQRVSYGVVHRLARALGVEMDDILTEPLQSPGLTNTEHPLLEHAFSQARQLDDAKQERFARMILPILSDLLTCECAVALARVTS